MKVTQDTAIVASWVTLYIIIRVIGRFFVGHEPNRNVWVLCFKPSELAKENASMPMQKKHAVPIQPFLPKPFIGRKYADI